MLFKPKNENIKINSINVGAGFDIISGTFVKGAKDEIIVNGGLGSVTAFVGPGNSFKSTIMHYFALSALSKILPQYNTGLHTYDTEMNISENRLEQLANNIEGLPKNIVTDNEPKWTIADKITYPANIWLKEIIEYFEDKKKSKDIDYTAFIDNKDKKIYYKHKVPSIIEIDSFTELEAESTMNLDEDIAKDDNSTQTMYMKQGLFKNKILPILLRYSVETNTPLLMTSHLGGKIDMGGMYAAKPPKDLPGMKSTEAVKGVNPKFFFLTTLAFITDKVEILKNNSTKEAEYPSSKSTEAANLVRVTLRIVRNKRGLSNINHTVVVSQTDGVLPDLSNFDRIRMAKYGMPSGKPKFSIDLYPDLTISRRTVYDQLLEDKKFARAVEITSDLYLLNKYHGYLNGEYSEGFLCTPKELYEDIKKLGYNWDELLDTRGWYTIDNYDKRLKPFLSTIDLLRMRKELYKPYWLKG